MRSTCKDRIESLEHWLRRLIDDELSRAYGDYFSHADGKGNRLIRNSLSKQVDQRRAREPSRYLRKIDAVFAIDIICNPQLFNKHFRAPLSIAFPEGRDEARTFLRRLLEPRNHLAHASEISIRQAEQVVCYTNDVIESLKKHYRDLGMQQDYDVPLILRVTDSWGQSFARSEFSDVHHGGIFKNFSNDPTFFLRPGEVLTIEVEVDQTFDPSNYKLEWTAKGLVKPIEGTKAVIPISNQSVGQQWHLQCRLTTDKDWHRMAIGSDDFLFLVYKVLPPLG